MNIILENNLIEDNITIHKKICIGVGWTNAIRFRSHCEIHS